MRRRMGGLSGALVVEGPVHDVVGDGLDALGAADGVDAAVLDPCRWWSVRGWCGGASARRLAAATASCRAMLMPMPPTGDMAWAASPMQSRPGSPPAFEVVDLDGEELDLVPGVELGGAAGEEGGELLEAGVEGFEAALLDGGEGAFGDDEAGLEVVVAVDEDEDAAEVDVAEGVLGVVGLAREAEPEDVDGDALLR